MTNLEKYLYQLRRIAEHRDKAAEKEIRKIYKELLKELNGFLGNIYATYSEDDMLNYSMLAAAGMDARFLEEVEQRINGITPKVTKLIQETTEEVYEACYDGMVNAVTKAAGNMEVLKGVFETISAVTPEVIRAAVNNPVSGLTLKDTLEKHRKEIIYDIKKNIGIGLTNGDRYSTMAKRIATSLDGDYNKSMRIVRTEVHRVRETGFNDAATELNNTLKQGNSGYVMAKTWRTMKDERVRPNTMRKTKKGWKKGKRGKYNHVKMDGVTIPQDELFEMPDSTPASPVTCMCPSQTGVAGHDCNCRCYVSYDLVLASELTKVKDGEKTIEEAVETSENKEKPFTPAKSLREAQEYAEKELGVKWAVAYTEDKFNLDVANAMNKALKDVSKKFGAIELNIIQILPKGIDAYACYSSGSRRIGLNKVAKTKAAIKKMEKQAKEQYSLGFWSGNAATHSLYHELGHAVQHKICDNNIAIKNRIDILYNRTFEEILGESTNFNWRLEKSLENKQACKDAGFSYYGLRNSGEFIAESIAQYFTMDNPSDIAKKVVETLLGGWE